MDEILTSELATRDSLQISRFQFKSLPNPDVVLQSLGKGLSEYRNMLYDSHLYACLQSRFAGVMSLEWDVDRGKSKSQLAKLIKSIFNTINVHSLIEEILQATLFGYQPLEIVWAYNGKYIVPSKIIGKPPEWFVYSQENQLQIKESMHSIEAVDAPEYKFLCPRVKATYVNPYGEGVLSRCYWPWLFKHGGRRFWFNFTEKYGMPFIIGSHEFGLDTKKISAFAESLSQLYQDAVLVKPKGTEVTITQTGTSTSSDIFSALISYCNAEISKAILGQTLTTEVGSTGSYAASKTHNSVRSEIVEADKRLVESTINELIAMIVELNFGSVPNELPAFILYEQEDVDKNIAERDKILSESGVKFTKVYFQKTYGFEDEDIEIAPVTPPVTPTLTQFAEQPKSDVIVASALQTQDTIDTFTSVASEMSVESVQSIIDDITEAFKKNKSLEKVDYSKLYNAVNRQDFEDNLAKTLFFVELLGSNAVNNEGEINVE